MKRGGVESTGDPWEDLANAVIFQAVKDYRRYAAMYLNLKDKPQETVIRKYKNKKRRTPLEECERNLWELESFFTSDWFSMLTDLDGEALLDRLSREAGIT